MASDQVNAPADTGCRRVVTLKLFLFQVSLGTTGNEKEKKRKVVP